MLLRSSEMLVNSVSVFICCELSEEFYYAEGGATEAYGSRAVCHYAEGGATEAYGSRAVCHYAEGGATEAYCSRAVCLSVRLSVTSISRRSLKTKR